MFDALNLPSTRYPAYPSGQWPCGAEERCKFGQNVLWCDVDNGGRHLDAKLLEKYRKIGDEPVDRILDLMDEDGQPLGAGHDLVVLAEACFHLQETSVSNDLNLSRFSAATRKALADFYRYHYRLPKWANFDEILEGQRVFLSYLPSIGASLYYRSLVPGFSIPKIGAVLFATGYLAPPSSRERVNKRLIDTGALLAACSRGGCSMHISDLLGGGQGWKAALQVRVLHAKVRRSLLRRRGDRAWNVDVLGVPINQEDMAATLLAFSKNATLGCEMILGFSLPLKERHAYMAFWRYIGWLLGVPTVHDDDFRACSNGLMALDPCGPGWNTHRPDVEEHSNALFQSIIFHIMKPDKTSIAISHHLLRVGRRQEETGESPDLLKSDNWFFFRSLQCRRFVGHSLADALQLPYHPKWYYRLFLWTASTVYLLLLRLYTCAALPISPFRIRILYWHQRSMVAFTDRWRRDHLERSIKRRQELVDEGETCSNTNLKVEVSENTKLCPFAMITNLE